MTRALVCFAIAVAIGNLFPAHGAEKSGVLLETFNVTAEGQLCGPGSHESRYPLDDFSGVLVYEATLEPANSTVFVRPCASNATTHTLDGADPSTLIVSLPTQCAHFWVVSNPESTTGCDKVSVKVRTETMASYCEIISQSNSTSDKPKFMCTATSTSTPSPSGATVLSMTAAATLAVFLTSLAAL